MMTMENALDFNAVKNILMENAITQAGKETLSQIQPFLEENKLKSALRTTTEARRILDMAGNPPITSLKNMDEFISIAEKGGCLVGEQLEEVAISLTGVYRLKQYLLKVPDQSFGILEDAQFLDPIDEFRKLVAYQIRNAKVDDNASDQLRTIRYEIEKNKQKIRQRAEGILAGNKEYVSDNFVSERNGRATIPIKKEYKSRIKGRIADKSSTGNTLFIAPDALEEYYEYAQQLFIEEENEVCKILYGLTAILAEHADVFQRNVRIIEKLDIIFAKGKLSQKQNGTEPKINTQRYIRIKNGRHPLMDEASSVPLNFQMGDGINGVIITGPNTGGKTVAIKTIALNNLMAQCGLHVTCEEAWFCMNDAYLCDIGDGQNISENLSTFSAHITNILFILKSARKESLIILDELGSGTDPAEGMGIAIAILEELKKSGALYLVTTHYPEVKKYAETAEGVLNARMAFDKENTKPLYQLEMGESGESCAFYIASKLGMPRFMLERAALASYGKSLSYEIALNSSDEIYRYDGLNAIKKQKQANTNLSAKKKFSRGDAVMVYPDKKIGIVVKESDEKGRVLIMQKESKLWINHKRLKLHIAAEEMYPENYDFSIVFDSVENRKLDKQMNKHYLSETTIFRENI